MRKTKSAILDAIDSTAKGLRRAGVEKPVTSDESESPKLALTSVVNRNPNARLSAFYLSRDRVLTLIGVQNLPARVLGALQGQDGTMSSAILSGAVGSYLLDAIASGGVKTLQQLAFENTLRPGAPFIYNGHFYGNGFGYNNKKAALTLTEKLDEPLPGMKLVFEFSKNGLLNDTAYTRMSGSTRLFAFGYITDIDAKTIRAVPYAIGDLVEYSSPLLAPFAPTLELQPEEIAQFAGMDQSWTPTKKEFARLAQFPERTVKELICELLGEHEVPSDWGGEECDVFSANLTVGSARQTGAFLLKGPAAFHPMTPKDCGKNGDQIYRLFNIPAHVYIVQHCHNIGAAVRKTVEAFAFGRSFIAPCRYVIMDGIATARLLRAHGRWNTR
jgi:hypothetical protein